MKNKKTKKQNKKNVFQIVALALISLLLLGTVIDVAIDLVKEEDPTEDVLPDDEQPDDETPEEPVVLTLTINGYEVEHLTIEYEEGMTWAEWVQSDYNTLDWYINDYDSVCQSVDGEPSEVFLDGAKGSDVINADIQYSQTA